MGWMRTHGVAEFGSANCTAWFPSANICAGGCPVALKGKSWQLGDMSMPGSSALGLSVALKSIGLCVAGLFPAEPAQMGNPAAAFPQSAPPWQLFQLCCWALTHGAWSCSSTATAPIRNVAVRHRRMVKTATKRGEKKERDRQTTLVQPQPKAMMKSGQGSKFRAPNRAPRCSIKQLLAGFLLMAPHTQQSIHRRHAQWEQLQRFAVERRQRRRSPC